VALGRLPTENCQQKIANGRLPTNIGIALAENCQQKIANGKLPTKKHKKNNIINFILFKIVSISRF
jgi:hypothetical protein